MKHANQVIRRNDDDANVGSFFSIENFTHLETEVNLYELLPSLSLSFSLSVPLSLSRNALCDNCVCFVCLLFWCAFRSFFPVYFFVPFFFFVRKIKYEHRAYIYMHCSSLHGNCSLWVCDIPLCTIFRNWFAFWC